MIEGSGSIPLTNGSGSRRPKKCGSGTLVLRVNTMPIVLDNHEFEVYGWKDYKTQKGLNLEVDSGNKQILK
jgi:hypothetical protein